MDEIEEDLDSSWAEAAEFQDNYEREVMEEIRVFFIYMDTAGALEKITKAVEKVVDGGLSKERLLHLIQSKRHLPHRGGVKYRFMDLLAFHIPLEPGELGEFIKREAEKTQVLERWKKGQGAEFLIRCYDFCDSWSFI